MLSAAAAKGCKMRDLADWCSVQCIRFFSTFGVSQEFPADRWFKANGRSKVQYSTARKVSGHSNDTPPIVPRRQTRCH